MTVELLLTANELVKHNAIITIPEEKVELAFSSPIYPVDHLVVSIRKGAEITQIRTNGKPVDITEQCTSAGLVEITATLEARGVAAKVWQIEPIVVKEIGGNFIAVPQIVELEARVATLEKAIVELTKLNA